MCQRTRQKICSAVLELHRIAVVSTCHRVGIDFLICSSQGKEYILTISDYLSKYVLAIPMEDKFVSGFTAALGRGDELNIWQITDFILHG